VNLDGEPTKAPRFLFTLRHRALRLHLPNDRLLVSGQAAGGVAAAGGGAAGAAGRPGLLRDVLVGARRLRRAARWRGPLARALLRLAAAAALLWAAYRMGAARARREWAAGRPTAAVAAGGEL